MTRVYVAERYEHGGTSARADESPERPPRRRYIVEVERRERGHKAPKKRERHKRR